MPVPTSYQDFWELTLRFNFANVSLEGTSGQTRGWTEKYHFPCGQAYATTPKIPPLLQAQTLVQARCALLGGNVSMVRNTLTLGSMFRDRWPIGNIVNYPLTTAGDLTDPDGGYCNDLETALLYRFENAGQRFTHQIRGIRDKWVDDEVLIAQTLKNSYGPYNSTNVTGLTLDDGPLPAPMTASFTTGVNGVITFTNTAGVLSAPVIGTPGSGLTISGLSSGVFTFNTVPGYVYSGSGPSFPASISITLTAGVITAVSISSTQSASITYPTGTTYTLAVDTDPLTLQQYLDDKTYIINFGAVVAQYCCFFNLGRVPKGSFVDAPTASVWPNGSSIPVANTTNPFTIVSNANNNMRFLIERVTSRRTGRMYKSKPARKKVAH